MGHIKKRKKKSKKNICQMNEWIPLFCPDTVSLYSISHIREDSGIEMRAWGSGAEPHSPQWPGWRGSGVGGVVPG